VAVGFSLVLQVIIAAGALTGGLVRIVGGLVHTDWAQVAVGVVGVLLGGAFAAMAYGHRPARATAKDTPTS
jgi:hypothetical protein